MIYQLAGSTDRISRIIVLNRRAGAVTNVPARKVTFGVGTNCDIGTHIERDYTKKEATALFGRKPDAVGGATNLFRWTLGPSGPGEGLEAPRNYGDGGSDLELETNVFHPGGAVRIEPDELVSSSTAERYEVLPSSAGALQLERAGAIVRATPAEIAEWKAKARVRYGDQVVKNIDASNVYRVTRYIRVPGHLCGPISFLVPSPRMISGTPCHGNVLNADGRILHWGGHFLPEDLRDSR
jgi:hypothetical protein